MANSPEHKDAFSAFFRGFTATVAGRSSSCVYVGGGKFVRGMKNALAEDTNALIRDGEMVRRDLAASVETLRRELQRA